MCKQKDVPSDFTFLGIDHVYHATWEGPDSRQFANNEKGRPDLYLNNDEE